MQPEGRSTIDKARSLGIQEFFMRSSLPWLALCGLLVCLVCKAGRAGDTARRRQPRKVMAMSVPVRAGPGGSYREIGRVGQGQVYEAIDRDCDGDWYRIRLSRGVSGWVLAELVWPFEIVDQDGASAAEGWLYRHVLGPSRLSGGAINLTVSCGALDANGLFVLRIGFQPSRHYAVEAMAGQSVGHLGSLLTYGAEALVFIGPWRTLVPYAAVGAGAATTLPHREGTLFARSTRPLLTAGGGLMLALRGSFTLRLDARQTMVCTADDIWTMVLVTGGLMLTF